MALSDILAAIEDESNRTCEAIVTENAAQLGALASQSAERTQRDTEEIEAVWRERLRRDRALARERAHLEELAQLRSAQERGFQELLSAVREALSARRQGSDYPIVLEILLRSAARFLPAVQAVVVHPDDVPAMQEALRRAGIELDVRGETQVDGGLIVEGPNGCRVDNTFASRLRLFEGQLRRDYARAIGLTDRSGEEAGNNERL